MRSSLSRHVRSRPRARGQALDLLRAPRGPAIVGPAGAELEGELRVALSDPDVAVRHAQLDDGAGGWTLSEEGSAAGPGSTGAGCASGRRRWVSARLLPRGFLVVVIAGVACLACISPSTNDTAGSNAVSTVASPVSVPSSGSLVPDMIDIASCPAVHGCQGTIGTSACPDDWAAIQSCLNANPGRHIWFSRQNGFSSANIAPPDYYLGQALVPCGNDQWLDGSTGLASGGAVLKFAAGATGFSIIKNVTSPGITCPQQTLPSNGARVSSMALQGSEPYVSGGTNTLTTANGVYVVATSVRLENLYVYGFGKHGIEIDSSQSSSDFADSFNISHVNIGQCRGNGMYVHGHDSNVGLVSEVTANSNGLFGFDEESFLGNTYVAPHAEANAGGAYRAVTASARNVFIGAYAESGQPPSKINGGALFLGGLHAPAVDYSLGPQMVVASDSTGVVSTPWRFDQNAPDGGADPISFWTNGIGQADKFVAWTGINHVDPVHYGTNSVAFRRTSDGVHLQGPDGGPTEHDTDMGWWGFRTYVDLPGFQNYPMLLSDSFTTTGLGWVWFPNGFYIGNDTYTARRRVSVGGGAPTTGAHRVGDLVLNTVPARGKPLGWICTVAGTPGSWEVVAPIGPDAGVRSTFGAILPGPVSSAWTAAQFTPDRAVTITRIQALAKTAPSCTTPPRLRVSNGGTSVDLSISAAANDSGSISTDFAAGVVIGVSTVVGACTVLPADVNVIVQYAMK